MTTESGLTFDLANDIDGPGYAAVQALDGDPVSGKVCFVVRRPEWLHRCPLPVQCHCHLPRRWVLHQALDPPQLAA